MALSTSRTALLQARQGYSACAATVEKKIRAGGLTPLLSEQIVGIGVAADWLRRAAEMEGITYVGKQLTESHRKESFVELMRYGFGWFGLNAIFSRPALLGLIGTPQFHGEFACFRVLFDATPLPNATSQTATLHTILQAPTAPRLPNEPPGTSVTSLYAINAKYIPSVVKKAATAKAVANAAASGNITALDLPTLLYAFRNWSVHGNALDGAFGSRPRFVEYVGVLLDVLAAVHVNTTRLLQAKL